MVGKTSPFNIKGIQERLRQTNSHESQGSISDIPHFLPSRYHVPLIASPLDPKATSWLQNKHKSDRFSLQKRPTIAHFEADKATGGIFRKQHEASTLELFFDLFFVANLAVFTNNYEKTSSGSVGNYVGFFAILWSTWFNISLFDVRFYVDSAFNRLVKLVTFGVFTAFTGLGAVYDTISNGGQTRAFRGIAIVLMLSRLMLLLQYATVLYFVRPFKKTLIPLCLMMLLYLATAMGFLGTYLDDRTNDQQDVQGLKHVIGWYAIIAVEAVLVIVISSTWRILSFKRTHLVERVGLLTLIIMGEGIIGLTKSVSYLIQGTSISPWEQSGKIIAAVALIYLVYILYFNPIDHDRFGTIRQQIWTLLHFPLHVALLLTEEGSAVTLLWDTCINSRAWLRSALPSLTEPSSGFNSVSSWIDSVNATMLKTADSLHYLSLQDTYDWNEDLDAVANITEPFGSSSWNERASEILSEMFNETTNFIFENFNFETSKSGESESDPNLKLEMYYTTYTVTFTYFYAAAGALMLLLAAMLWIGKNNKTREEYTSILVRVIVGVALPFTIIPAYTQSAETGFMFTQNGWIIAIVTFGFLFAVIVDNYIASFVHWRTAKQKKREDDSNDRDGSELEKGSVDVHHGKHTDGFTTTQRFDRPSRSSTNERERERDHDTHHRESSDEHHRLVSNHEGDEPTNDSKFRDRSVSQANNTLTQVDTSYSYSSSANDNDRDGVGNTNSHHQQQNYNSNEYTPQTTIHHLHPAASPPSSGTGKIVSTPPPTLPPLSHSHSEHFQFN